MELERGQNIFCQEQWEERSLSQPPVMNCHQKRSVTEKQFSATPPPFNYCTVPPPSPHPKSERKQKKRKQNVLQQLPTSSVLFTF